MNDKLEVWLKDIHYDHQYLWSDNGNMIAEIRGWGALQYMFDTSNEAAKFQDEVGKFIAEAINEKIKILNQNK